MCLPFQLLKYLTDFEEILYGRYAFGRHPRFVRFHFVQSVIATWREHEFVTWEGREMHTNFCSET